MFIWANSRALQRVWPFVQRNKRPFKSIPLVILASSCELLIFRMNCIKLLKICIDLISELQTISNKILNPVNYGELFNQDTKSALQEAYGESIDNPDVNNAVLVLTSPPKAYLEAAKIFRWTCRCISEALLYYKLNEHCSDAIELIRAHANAYGYLAIFEPDLSRKVRMQIPQYRLLLILVNPEVV